MYTTRRGVSIEETRFLLKATQLNIHPIVYVVFPEHTNTYTIVLQEYPTNLSGVLNRGLYYLQICQHIRELYLQKIVHQNIWETNIVIKGNECRLINFDHTISSSTHSDIELQVAYLNDLNDAYQICYPFGQCQIL